MKLIIFDVDGTLVDSRSLILESHQIVFSEFCLPLPSPANSLALVGKTLDLILAQLAGPTAPIRDMLAFKGNQLSVKRDE
jgi:phosphoglycolate phosphatase